MFDGFDKTVDVPGPEGNQAVQLAGGQVRHEVFLGDKLLVGEGYLVENHLGADARNGELACRIDGQHDQGVQLAERLGEFIGENMRLSPVTLDNMRDVPELLKFYMGENTPVRREYILNKLEVVDYE